MRKAGSKGKSTARTDTFDELRRQINSVEATLVGSVDMLREADLPDTAKELTKDLVRLRIWTKPGGWIDHLRDDPEEGEI